MEGERLEELFELRGLINAVEIENILVEIVTDELLKALFGVGRMRDDVGVIAIK